LDIIEIDRICEAVERTKGFLENIFTEDEIAYFKTKNMRYETIAGNFSGKEAFVKAIGTGFIDINPLDIEILRDGKGKPYINVLRKEIKEKLTNSKIFITITHSKNYALANVIIEE
ncbi:MAG TPA: holo-[acyl-carrier-protein] synthase, partial [Clostridiales bacterium]|nr:holo-[acyl-carrier-protein] synthase [Clostridiales bacterium]